MNKNQFFQFVLFLRKNGWQVFGPEKEGEDIKIKELAKPEDFYFGNRLPFSSFKEFFISPYEVLFEFIKDKPLTPNPAKKNIALLGVNILDLKSVLLYDLVFKEDPYYKNRRKHILIIGWGINPEPEQNIYCVKFSQELLARLKYDIFLLPEPEMENFKVYSGSELGRKILSDFGLKDLQGATLCKLKKDLQGATLCKLKDLQGATPCKTSNGVKLEEGLIKKFGEKIEKGFNAEIWRDLGETCIECGKCSEICPMCFCFKIADSFDSAGNKVFRKRSWDSCFFDEFSEVAGGHKFLDETRKKIYFWYFHKFVRIPIEYKILGCVGCRRCSKVCPVGIDIKKVLSEIQNGNVKNEQ